MHDEAKRRQQIIAIGLILPALEQINLDHYILPNDLIEIVTNNPFIPPDRQHIFLRGLYHYAALRCLRVGLQHRTHIQLMIICSYRTTRHRIVTPYDAMQSGQVRDNDSDC